jgi:hypothetical protein
MSGRGGTADLFITDNQVLRGAKPRWVAESDKIRGNFPQFVLKSRRGTDSISAVEGTILNRGRDYEVRIEIPSDYPYQIPRILPLGWNPGNSPHRYSDGSLCVMDSSEWGHSYTIAYLIAKTAVWVAKWNRWRETGYWPGHQDD